MAWVKLDDQFPDHPKVVAAGPLAKGLFVDALCYANRLLTDGFIPDRIALRLASEYGPYTDPAALIDKLIACALWGGAAGGYQIHEYLDYQPSAEKVKEERAANAKRQAEWRERKTNGSRNGVTDTVSNGPNNADVTPAPYPSRTRPSSATDVADSDADNARATTRAKAEPAKRAHRLPTEWQPAEPITAWAEKLCLPEPELEVELEKFRDHFRSTGKTYVDWDAAWRNWMRRSVDFAANQRRPAAPTPMRSTGLARAAPPVMTHGSVPSAAQQLAEWRAGGQPHEQES